MVLTKSKAKRSLAESIKEVRQIRQKKYVAFKEETTPKKKITTSRQLKNQGKKLKINEQLRRSPRLKSKQSKAVITVPKATIRRHKKIKRRTLLPTVNEMMAAHKNAVVIANIRQKKQPLVVPTPVGRLIIFDTETTGLGAWDRIVEIGAVELINGKLTGNNFQSYVNCQRKSHWGALNCHGLTCAFLSQFRGIDEVVKEFMEYIADSPLLAHNAKFDMRMLNNELRRLRLSQLPITRAFCSWSWYKCLFAEGRTNLDSICGKFGIDVSHRRIHGALLDSEILTKVVQRLWKITPELNKSNVEPDKAEVKVFKKKKKKKELQPVESSIPGGGIASRVRARRVRGSKPKAL